LEVSLKEPTDAGEEISFHHVILGGYSHLIGNVSYMPEKAILKRNLKWICKLNFSVRFMVGLGETYYIVRRSASNA